MTKPAVINGVAHFPTKWSKTKRPVLIVDRTRGKLLLWLKGRIRCRSR